AMISAPCCSASSRPSAVLPQPVGPVRTMAFWNGSGTIPMLYLMPHHIPVLPSAVLTYLTPVSGDIMVDATVGAGGHGRLLAERVMPAGKILGLDQDEEMLKLAEASLQGLPVQLVHGNFHRLFEIVRLWSPPGVSGVLADLGLNSAQLDNAERGFSFQRDGP